MAGIDERVTVIGDWVPTNPSPRAFFSTGLDWDFVSTSYSDIGENGNNRISVGLEKVKLTVNTKENDEAGRTVSGDPFSETNLSSGHKSNLNGSLGERRAARAGFNAPRLNMERFRCPNLCSSPEVQSPYLTIPPGLSPTTLLDSPVFLSNSLAQPSPTTGKFLFSCSNNKNSILFSEAADRIEDTFIQGANASSFEFKSNMESSSSFFPGSVNKVNPAANNQRSLPRIEVFVQSENPLQSVSAGPADVHSQGRHVLHPETDFSRSSTGKDTGSRNVTSDPRVSDAVVCSSEVPPSLNDRQDEGDQRGSGELNSITAGGALSEDGYNWRKYGQKQVKGSEYPRSYYKCTHPNCQVKKKVERSYEGHITEIIYKGIHNHNKPQPNRRSAVGFSNPLSEMQMENSEQVGGHAGADGDPFLADPQPGNVGGGPDWKHENLEVTSSASASPEFCDPSTSVQAQNGATLDAGDAVEVSSTLSNDEDEDDRGTHGSVSLGYEVEGDESESKRRKIDTCAMETSGATRAIREPRVVVQTTSEVDILDDGYRWRKYGQKVVKGNPNPRSYYKCTNAGCTVRKHVERASHDLKSVITTYEGKHNHDVPAARNSSHVNIGTCTAPAQAAQVHIQRPEPSSVADSMARYERPTCLSSFGLPGPSPGLALAMSQSGLANLPMPGLGAGQLKLPMLPGHPFAGQQRLVNEMGFMMPKGELKEEPTSDPGRSISNGSSVYHQIMSRLPLGPQM